MNSLFGIFWSGNYAPHGACLFWRPELLWTHVIADAFIALAYFSIPVALVMLVRRRQDLAFGWAFWCFAIFILACGLTHVIGIWTMWQPVYGLEAFVKVVTAVASLATAALLWPLLPKALALPSPDKLQRANDELAAALRERDIALTELRAQIDQRERAEAALLQSQKLEALGQLTGGIAHDFNNLLQAVSGNLELVARKPDDSGKVSQWTRAALQALRRGRALTGQLLAFSRKQRLEIASVPVAGLIDGMRDLIERAVAPLSTVEIEPIDPDLKVSADPLQLELAILNLAFNARDAMPDGGTLRVSAIRHGGIAPPGLEEGDWVAITVADSGSGMEPEVLARAVEPFFTTKEVGRGTGMGLAMVFGVTSQSGGTVDIDSTPGQGTRVTLYLRPSTAAAEVREAAEPEADPTADLRGLKVLLIDDDDRVRTALRDMLASAGADVAEASDGESGLAAMEREAPDMLIVDFAMPGMNGAEVARRAQERHAALPILMITGFSDTAAIEALEGHVQVLRKPFEQSDLMREIGTLSGRA